MDNDQVTSQMSLTEKNLSFFSSALIHSCTYFQEIHKHLMNFSIVN